MIPPDDGGAGVGNGFDALAAEDAFALGVEAVGAAADGARVVDEAGTVVRVEEGADNGTCGVVEGSKCRVDSFAHSIWQLAVGRAHALPLDGRDGWNGGEGAATIGTSPAARPTLVMGNNLRSASVNRSIDLIQFRNFLNPGHKRKQCVIKTILKKTAWNLKPAVW